VLDLLEGICLLGGVAMLWDFSWPIIIKRCCGTVENDFCLRELIVEGRMTVAMVLVLP